MPRWICLHLLHDRVIGSLGRTMVMASPRDPDRSIASPLCICLGHATLIGRFCTCIFQTLKPRNFVSIGYVFFVIGIRVKSCFRWFRNTVYPRSRNRPGSTTNRTLLLQVTKTTSWLRMLNLLAPSVGGSSSEHPRTANVSLLIWCLRNQPCIHLRTRKRQDLIQQVSPLCHLWLAVNIRLV